MALCNSLSFAFLHLCLGNGYYKTILSVLLLSLTYWGDAGVAAESSEGLVLEDLYLLQDKDPERKKGKELREKGGKK